MTTTQRHTSSKHLPSAPTAFVNGDEAKNAGGVIMLTIPFDGPDFVGHRAVVNTTTGLRRGMVRAFGPDGLDLVVELPDGRTRFRHFAPAEVLVLAIA